MTFVLNLRNLTAKKTEDPVACEKEKRKKEVNFRLQWYSFSTTAM